MPPHATPIEPHRDALALLARGERQAALRVLAGAADAAGVDSDEARRCGLIRRLAEPAGGMGAAGGAEGSYATAPAKSDDDSASPLPDLGVLRRMVEARAALVTGRVEALVAHLDGLDGQAEPGQPAAPDPLHPWLRLLAAALHQADFRFTARPEARARALRDTGRVSDRADLPHLAVPARALMASVHLLAGEYHATERLCRAALELAAAAGVGDSAATAMAHQFLGYALLEWDRTDEAGRALERAWELAGPDGRGVRSGVARIMGGLRAAEGDRAGGEAWLRRLEELMAEPLTLRNREWLAAVRARQSLGSGDLRPVEAWLRAYDYRPDRFPGRPEVLARLHELEQAMAFLEATGQWGRLREVAETVSAASTGARRWFAVRALTAEAVALEAEGAHARADAAWSRAVEEGRSGSLLRSYLEGDPRREVLARRSARQDGDADAVRIAAALEARGKRRRPGPLTERQLDVLARVARGETNKSVARELGLSVSTVKTHLRDIFSRLDVSTRTQAVARARDLDLV